MTEGAPTPLRTRAAALAAASATAAATVSLIEAARWELRDPTTELQMDETAEHLADALQMVLGAELEDAECTGDRREAVGQLLGAVRRFIAGWA